MRFRRRRRRGSAPAPGGEGGWDLKNNLVLNILGGLVGVGIGLAVIPFANKIEKDAEDPQKKGESAFHSDVREAFDKILDGGSYVFEEKIPISSLSFMNPVRNQGGSPTWSEGIEEKWNQKRQELGGLRLGIHCTPDCVSASRHRVTLTGNRKQPVHITAIRAKVVAEEAVPAGTLFLRSPQGGGPVDTIYIDLDSDRKDAFQTDDEGKSTGRLFTDEENRYAEEGEPLVFKVVAVAAKPVTYLWELEVEVTQDGKAETVTVRGEKGRPFRTIGWRAVKNYGAVYDYTGGTLEPIQWNP